MIAPVLHSDSFGRWPAAHMAVAVAKAAEEHGAPNSFAPGELAAHYSFYSPTRFGRSKHAIISILRKHGYAVEYRQRRFHVTALPEGR